MDFSLTNIWYRTWHDKKGRVVIWQTPNIPLIGWLVFTIISLLISGNGANITQDIGIACLTIWSLLEVVKGVNYFRKGLGLIVLAMAVISIVHIF